MSDDLNQLPLTTQERHHIEELGVSGCAGLMALVRAAPAAFSNHFGSERASVLTAELERVLGAQTTGAMMPQQREWATGALVARSAPALSRAQPLVIKRNELFDQLQALKRQPDGSRDRARIAALERELNDLIQQL